MMSAQLAQSAVVHTLRPTVGPTSWSSDSEHFDLFQGLGARMTFDRDAEIYGEGEAADFVYRVASGCVRTYKVLADGRRQIGDFLLPGFGLGDISSRRFIELRFHVLDHREWTPGGSTRTRSYQVFGTGCLV